MALVWICTWHLGCGGSREQQAGQKSAGSSATGAKITQFYAAPAVIEAGEESLLCYGVEGADWVRIDPPVEQLNPSLSRCIKVRPATTQRYTLKVPGREQAVEVTVLPARSKKSKAPHLIRLFVADMKTASPGQRVTLCYGVLNAKSVKLDPGGESLEPAERRCIAKTVQSTTKFELTVVGKDGTSEITDLTVEVKP